VTFNLVVTDERNAMSAEHHYRICSLRSLPGTMDWGITDPSEVVVAQFDRWSDAAKFRTIKNAELEAAKVPPMANDSVLRSGGQTKQYGPRPHIATAQPRPDR
jgi:hypothetical protein